MQKSITGLHCICVWALRAVQTGRGTAWAAGGKSSGVAAWAERVHALRAAPVLDDGAEIGTCPLCSFLSTGGKHLAASATRS